MGASPRVLNGPCMQDQPFAEKDLPEGLHHPGYSMVYEIQIIWCERPV